MEQLNQQEEVLALGKKIIAELSSNNEDKLSLLEKWMGHYIAELIHKIDREDNTIEKEKLQKECFDAILKLWEKRNCIPPKTMPLSRVKQAINTLNELKKERSLWERIQSLTPNSWENLAITIHENYIEYIKICIQSSIVDDAISWEKTWFNEANHFLSNEEKELIDELKSFLENNSTAISFITKEEDRSTSELSKERIDRVFDRLESITNGQKQAIKMLRKKIAKKK